MKKRFLKPRNGRLKKIMGILLFNEKTILMNEALNKLNKEPLNNLELMRLEIYYTDLMEAITQRLKIKGYIIK